MTNTTLAINGDEFLGYKKLSLTTSVFELAAVLDFSVAESWYQGNRAKTIKPNQEFELSHNGLIACQGFIDGREVSYTSQDHQVRWIGRNSGGDLADCTAVHATGEFKNQAAGSIIGQLVEPFINRVTFGAGVISTAPMSFALETGETRAEALHRLLAKQGWHPQITADGTLYISSKPKRADGALVLGQNIKTGNLVQNHSGRFHRYRVASQTNSQAWQGKTIPATAQPDVSLIDPAIRAPRELVIWEDSATEAECRKRCEYERASRRGQGEGIEYSVAGWLQQAPSPGVTTRLWTAGETVPVYDPYMEIDAELLIKDVTLAFDDQQGHHSLITVTHPDALLAEPEATEESLEGMGWDCKFDANGRSACEHPADLAEAQQ